MDIWKCSLNVIYIHLTFSSVKVGYISYFFPFDFRIEITSKTYFDKPHLRERNTQDVHLIELEYVGSFSCTLGNRSDKNKLFPL